jgi:sodium/potassium/calcium exchanger 6
LNRFSFVIRPPEANELSVEPRKTYKSELMKCFKFYDKDDFENSGKIGKAISIAMTPFYIGGYWTIPILPINRDHYKSKWNKPLAMIQAFLIPIAFLVFLYQYKEPPIGGIERYVLALMCSITFFVIVFMTSNLEEPPGYWCIFPFIGFGTGMLWIFIEANEILNILTSLGTFWNVSNAVMGLTFLGWANNVGDFVADLAIAKDGQARCAFSAAFAGPPLYLLASVGLACFVTSMTNNAAPIPIFIENVEVVLFISVICCALASLIPLVTRKFHADKVVAISLIICYIIALTISLLTGLEILWPPVRE